MRDFGGILLKAGEYFLDRYNPGDAKIRFDFILDRVTPVSYYLKWQPNLVVLGGQLSLLAVRFHSRYGS